MPKKPNAANTEDEILKAFDAPVKVVDSDAAEAKILEAFDAGEKKPLGITPAEAGLTSFVRSISLGSAPAIAGVGSAARTALEQITKGGDVIEPSKKAYESMRSKYAEFQDQASKEQAGASLLGTLAGGAVTALPATKVMQGLSGLPAVLQSVRTGTVLGAGTATGESLGQGETKELPARALEGAAVGGTLDLLTQGAFKGLSKARATLKNIASSKSGINNKVIDVYLENPQKLDAAIEEVKKGGMEATENFRKSVMDSVKAAKDKLNAKIVSALQKSPPVEMDMSKVLTTLENAKKGLKPGKHGQAIAEIDDMIAKILQDDPTGITDQTGMHEIKQYLQDLASYKKGGQIYSVSDKASKAAREAAREAKIALDNLFPEYAEANAGHMELRRIEKALNKNLLKEGATDASLVSVGLGNNTAQREQLKKLGEATGRDLIKEVEELAAAKSLSDPSFLPQYTTGKSVAAQRLGSIGLPGAGLGAAYGATQGNTPEEKISNAAAMGALGWGVGGISNAMFSPAGIRYLLRAGKITKATAEMANKALGKPAKAAATQSIIRKLNEGKK